MYLMLLLLCGGEIWTEVPVHDIHISPEKKLVVVRVITPTGGWRVVSESCFYTEKPDYRRFRIWGRKPIESAPQLPVIHTVVISLDKSGHKGIEIYDGKHTIRIEVVKQ